MIPALKPSTTFAALLGQIIIAVAVLAPNPVSAAATTRTTTIGTDPIALTSPADTCFLDPVAPRDGSLVTAVQQSIGTANRLVAIFADCAELTAWRNGEALLENHGQIQTMVKLEDKRLTMPRQAFTAAVCRHAAPAAPDGAPAAAAAVTDTRLADEISRLAVGQQHFLGAVAVDAEACFTGLIQKFRTSKGTARPELAVTATTLVQGKILYIYLYAPATGESAFKTLLTKAQRLVRAILKANGGP